MGRQNQFVREALCLPYLVAFHEDSSCLILGDDRLWFEVMVAISNNIDLPERLLPKVSTRLGFDRVDFRTYTWLGGIRAIAWGTDGKDSGSRCLAMTRFAHCNY